MFLPFEVEIEESVMYRRETPVAVYTLLAACAAVHLYLWLKLPFEMRMDIFYRFGAVKFGFDWWTAVTCTFLHGGWGHLLGNLFFLWVYGRDVERYLGVWRFLVLYFGGGVVSICIHMLTVSAFYVDEPTIGASGAISAVLGAFLVFWPNARLRCLFFSIVSFRPILMQAPAFIVLGLWFAGQLVYSLKLVGDIGNIAFWAHVGGFAAGAGIGTALERWRRAQIREIEAAAREPLVQAWKAYLLGGWERAQAHAETIDEPAILDAHGTCQFLRGLLDVRQHADTQAQAHLVRAFCQARDYRKDDTLLSIYLQMLGLFKPEDIPAFTHKDAGFAAFALQQHDLALAAFSRALAGGSDAAVEPMLRAVRGILRKQRRQSRTVPP